MNADVGCGDPNTCTPCYFEHQEATCNSDNECSPLGGDSCDTGYYDCTSDLPGCETFLGVREGYDQACESEGTRFCLTSGECWVVDCDSASQGEESYVIDETGKSCQLLAAE